MQVEEAEITQGQQIASRTATNNIHFKGNIFIGKLWGMSKIKKLSG